jgi:DNA-binding NtrC family response regulator
LAELALHFLREFQARHGATRSSFTEDALESLRVHDWPGNIRELKAVVDNAAMFAQGEVITERDVLAALGSRCEVNEAVTSLRQPRPEPHDEPASMNSTAGPAVSGTRRVLSLPDQQRAMILKAFEDSDRNLSRAALDLGIPRSTLRARLKRYGVR